MIALLTATGVSLRQALIRNGVTWAMLLVGFVVVYLFVPNLSDAVLGDALALGAGGFLYLAYLSFEERQWGLLPSAAATALGVGLIVLARLLF